MANNTVLITYDIDRQHILVKDEMKKLGYVDTLTGKSVDKPGVTGTLYLPNTTLYLKRDGANPVSAADEFKSLIKRLNLQLGFKDQITIERLFVCEPQNWLAEPGKPHGK